MRIAKKLAWVAAIALTAILLVNGISRSKSFQLLGDLVSHIDTSEKVVALTFDDGPNSPYTDQMLEVLRRHQVKATFFVVGRALKKQPETAKLVLSQGHELANHSYSHAKMVFKSPAFVRTEIEETDQQLRAVGVTPSQLFRAPYGRKLLVLPYVLTQLQKVNVLWDVNPADYKAPSAEAIATSVLNQVKPGSIVLLHDGGGKRDKTVAATDRIIRALKDQGYRFETVSELIREFRPEVLKQSVNAPTL